MSSLLALIAMVAFVLSAIFSYPENLYFVMAASFIMLAATYLKVEGLKR